MPLRFVDRIELKATTPLTEPQHARLAAVGPLYFGGEGPAQLASDDFDDDPMETRTLMFCFEWKLFEGPEHRFDAWLYMTDSGAIFKAGTVERVADIIQFGLQCGDHALRAEIGPAMVDARLLPFADSSYKEFFDLLTEQTGAPTIPLPIVAGPVPKRASVGKPGAAKPAVKTAPRKPAPKKTAVKKPSKKAKAPEKKAAPTKVVAKKVVAKKTAPKKKAPKKARRRR